MKRIIALLLILCLLLCACGKKDTTAEGTQGTTDNTIAEVDPTKESTEEPTETSEATEETTEPVEPAYRHPLNGEALDAPWSGRVTAVVINNLQEAMPQCGISKADVFFEVEVESSITRCVALFTDFSGVEAIGPVRSARSAFNSIAAAFDANLIHCGGSPFALNAEYDDSGKQLKNWRHINEMQNPDYFYRDKDRQKNGYAFEHTLFTKGDLLQKALEDKKLNTPSEKDAFGLQFQNNVVLKGEKAEEITVTFKNTKTSTFVYDAQTGLYQMNQFGAPHLDGNDKTPVTFKNVLAIYTYQHVASNGMHMFYDTVNTSGEGYAAINGQIVPILWSREDVYSPFTYTLADGTPLVLDVGTTYVALVGTKHPISYK